MRQFSSLGCFLSAALVLRKLCSYSYTLTQALILTAAARLGGPRESDRDLSKGIRIKWSGGDGHGTWPPGGGGRVETLKTRPRTPSPPDSLMVQTL